MKVAAAIAVIIAAVLIACSSEPTTLQTQPARTTAPTANPMATAATEAPVEKATTKATPTLEPTEAADSNGTGVSDARTNHVPYRRYGTAYRHAGSDADGDPHVGNQTPEGGSRRDPDRTAGLRPR